MDVRNVGRATFDSWLRITRLPLDVASRLLPNGDHGPRTPAMLLIDRLDATIRDTVGSLFGDDELREDAHRRRAAATERARARELRIEAETKRRAADTTFARRQETIEEQRARAEQTAENRKEQADREKTQREQRAKQAAAQQARVVEDVEQQKKAAAETKAKKQRLQVLETEADALDTETDALTATDEAQRLRNAASAAKAARKSTS